MDNPVLLIPSWLDLCGERTLMAIRTDIAHPFKSECNGVAMDLGDFTVFIFEDPSDGYRSSSTNPLFTREPLYAFCDSPNYIRAPVLIRRWERGDYGGEADGVEFIDKRNGKTILRVGTDNSDDYYPSFVCDWQPNNLGEGL